MEIWIVVVQKVAMAGGVVLGCGVKGVGGDGRRCLILRVLS